MDCVSLGGVMSSVYDPVSNTFDQTVDPRAKIFFSAILDIDNISFSVSPWLSQTNL